MLSATHREDDAVHRANDWFSDFHAMRNRLFHGAIDNPVTIAVLDTGIDIKNPKIMEDWGRHPQSAGAYRDFLADSATAGEMDTGIITEARASKIIQQLRQRGRDVPQDITGHGTHVAGIIMQLCPEASLCVGRVMERNIIDEVEGTRAAAKRLALAIIYATNVWQAKIISLSIGFHKEMLGSAEKAIIRNAIEFATNKRVLIFAAASNAGNRQSILFPASEPDPIFCINSSNGYGDASDFNPPHQGQHENFSILGEGVKSTSLQKPEDLNENGEAIATLKARKGTSVATPIAAAVAATIIHFSRQWEPADFAKLETRRGIKCILKDMATKNQAKFYDIVPWQGVFSLTAEEFQNPIKSAVVKIEKELTANY